MRGGARRQAVPRVDQALLDGVVQQHVVTHGRRTALCLGPYEFIGRCQAVSGAGIAHNEHLLDVLLDHFPQGELRASQLRTAVMKVAKQFPDINTTGLSDELWCGLKADKINTILAHLRRYNTDRLRQQQMRSKSTDADAAVVQRLADKLALLDTDGITGSSCSEVTPAASAPSKKKLKREVSLDADGFPNMLRESSPHPGPPAQKLKAVDLEALSVVDPLFSEALRDMGFSAGASSKPSSPVEVHPVSKSTSRAKAKAKVETKVQSVSGQQPWHSKAFGRLYLTLASTQSYIQVMKEDVGKKVLLVSVPAGKAQNHQHVIAELARWISKQDGSLTKEAVIAKKDKLLACQ